MTDHLADGTTIRHVAEFNRTNIVRVRCSVIELRALCQQPTDIRQFLIRQFIVIACKHTCNSFFLRIVGGTHTEALQFPDQRVRSQHIDGTGSIFLLQIMRCCNRSRQKVRACCRDAQLCKFFPVICYAHRRIICDKHIISAVLGQSV